tara:strand:- start:2933 stop:3316 length:384 start_codon:yes stop_codon:yes gene_type:complete
MVEQSKAKGAGFDLSKYQLSSANKKIQVKIDDTGDEFEVTIKPISWSKRNQLLSKCLQFNQNGQDTSFNGDLYVREMLKEMIVEAPWGRTSEAFLTSIDDRLGGALEALVPNAFASDGIDSNAVKKE